MALADILDAVGAALGERAKFKDGPEHLGEYAAPPRVIAVPTEDSFGDSHATWSGGPEPLHDCEATVEFHVWGATRKLAETLRNQLIRAIREAVQYNYTLSGGHWEAQDAKVVKECGRVYVLRVIFPVPVTEEPGQPGAELEATIETVTTSTGVAP
jgi:hypothetical protein